MTEKSTSGKKDTQKLQRAIVDGLEEVKAQDIQVFDTEHLSPLFERVIVAAGTSNRQTKALAASVRDKVREAGFPKPRIEGEENGEWIIVDCGAAVAHIMQPNIRQYYNLEEIWGDKPVRLKLGAARPAAKAAAKKSVPGASTTGAGKGAGGAPKASPRQAARSATGAQADGAAAKRARTPKSESKAAVSMVKRPSPAIKSAVTKVVVPAAAKRAPAKKAAARTAPAKPAPAKRTAARKPAAGQA